MASTTPSESNKLTTYFYETFDNLTGAFLPQISFRCKDVQRGRGEEGEP